jgi:hypothetical protein
MLGKAVWTERREALGGKVSRGDGAVWRWVVYWACSLTTAAVCCLVLAGDGNGRALDPVSQRRG